MCIFNSVDGDPELKKSVTEFCKLSPTLSVNHTDFPPTQLRPLALSIETKKPDVDGDKAKLQMGVWHATQWAFLEWAVGQKILRQRRPDRLGETRADDSFETAKRTALAELGFIPGIIVQGHDWRLVLTTCGDVGKPTFWAERLFGSTTSYVDIYSIVAGVRELTAWARDVYLPWLQKNVLC